MENEVVTGISLAVGNAREISPDGLWPCPPTRARLTVARFASRCNCDLRQTVYICEKVIFLYTWGSCEDSIREYLLSE